MKRVLTSAAAVMLASVTATAHLGPGRLAITLDNPRVNEVSDTRLVVSFDVRGELGGLLTLLIDRDPATQSITGGEWALVLTQVPHGDAEPRDEHPSGEPVRGESTPHSDPPEPERVGTATGRLLGGALIGTPAGRLSAMADVELTVDAGTLELGRALATARLDVPSLRNRTAPNGTLVLTLL
jgi:hypothetical protein